MKNRIIALAVGMALLLFSLLTAQGPDTLWTKTFGGTHDDFGYSVQQTIDGGYVITGSTKSYGAGWEDVWLIKTDSTGNLTCNKTFGGATSDEARSVQQTNDGGYIITGYTTSYGAGHYDVWLIKTDSVGNISWNKTFGDIEFDCGLFVRQTSDSGYIIVGMTESYGTGGRDVWLIKTDSVGNLSWDKTFGGALDEEGWSVQQTSDDGYIIVGMTESYGAGGRDVWLIKTDSAGNLTWDKTFGGTLDDKGFSVKQISDDGYIITGFSHSYGAGGADEWLIRTDSAGNLTWDKTFGGTDYDYGLSIQQTNDSGYVISGLSASYGAGNADVWLVKTDSAGNMIWNATFGGAGYDDGFSVQQTIDGGYIITGSTSSYGAGGVDIFLVKTNPYFALLSPNGGEILFCTDTIPITWICEKFPSTEHSFQLLFSSDGGNTYTDTIATSISQDSTSWQWCVPTIYTSTCKVKIQAFDTLNNLLEEDESDSNFTIQDGINPTAEIHKPNGGEVFSIGTIEPVTWEASDNIGIDSIVLEYSTNGGSDWTYVASPPSSDTIYYWVIPPTPSAECLMKVKAFDAIMNMAEDISDSLFEIQDDSIPQVTVIIPNGGEVWNGNEVHAIRWYSDDNVGIDSVNITLSLDGGTTFPVFVSHIVGNDSIYQWVVPETTSTECIMKIEAYDAAEHVGFDISDSTFVIITEADVSGSENPIPHKTLLRSIAPNPFRHNTKIYFQIAKRTLVSAELFDVSGRHFETIIDKEYIPGYYSVTVCNTITSGIYFLKIKTGKKEWFRKIVKIQ